MNPTATPARSAPPSGLQDLAGVPFPVVSVAPVLLPRAGRGDPLALRVSAPTSGHHLPVVLFAHGYGSSLHAYGPLTDFWAGHGFVVVQPTFVDSRTVGRPADDPDRPRWWRDRVDDMVLALDHLERIADAVPGLGGRLDTGRVAVAGHSFGGQTAAVLLGLRVGDPAGRPGPDLSDPRVSAGILLATAGEGGDALKPGVAETLPWLAAPDFSTMTSPSLVVYGDADVNPLTTRGAEWGAEPYRLSPGARSLVTLVGAEHSLGGIPGYEAAETTDANPGRVAALQQLTWAFLRTAFDPADPAWPAAVAAFDAAPERLGRIESR